MELKKIVKTRKAISKWLSILLIIFLFLFVGILLIGKISNKTFYYFNNRFDVVLSDSMSVKNMEYIDFLKGHDNQIQRDDFVISKRIDDSTPLNIYDIVLFNSQEFGTNMHRIVDIKYEGKRCVLKELKKEVIDTNEVFSFNSLTSEIRIKDSLIFSDIEIICYTKEKAYEPTEYYVLVNDGQVVVDVQSTLVDNNYYKNTLTYHKSEAASTFAITKRNHNFEAEFESIKLSSNQKKYVINSSLLTEEQEQTYLFDKYALYETRGDKSNTADGWFKRDQLISKVHTVIPKFGIFIKFITSPWGIAMVVGLCLLPVIYSFLANRKWKEKK